MDEKEEDLDNILVSASTSQSTSTVSESKTPSSSKKGRL